jgi:hypothetical protein
MFVLLLPRFLDLRSSLRQRPGIVHRGAAMR